jgi:hypothetical protein
MRLNISRLVIKKSADRRSMCVITAQRGLQRWCPSNALHLRPDRARRAAAPPRR